MKKKQIITGMLVLAAAVAATSAQASVVTIGGLTFSVDKTATGVGTNPGGAGGYDIWDITVTNLTGADAQSGANGAGISLIDGKFAVTGTASATNALLTPGKSDTVVMNNTKNAAYQGGSRVASAVGSTAGITGASFTNFDNFLQDGSTPVRGGQVAGTSTATSTWSSFLQGTWFATGTPFVGPATFTSSNGQDDPLFAELIVTHGAQWTYTGKVTTGNDNSTILTIPSSSGPTPPSISLTSAATKTAAGTAGVAGSSGSYHVTSVDNISPVGSGSVAISDIGNESGTFIAGINVSGVADLNALATALTGNGWTVTAINGPITGMPGTWNLEATTSNPTTAGANDFLNIDLAGQGNITAVAAIPEPSTLGLAGLGAVLAAARRKRRA